MSRGDDDPRLACGERGLAYHGPLMYEVKILKVFDPNTGLTTALLPLAAGARAVGAKKTSVGEDPTAPDAQRRMFYVHYRGWKASWDEWISTDRLLPFSEESLLNEKRMRKQIKEETRKPPSTGRRGRARAAVATEDSPGGEKSAGGSKLASPNRDGATSKAHAEAKPARASTRVGRLTTSSGAVMSTSTASTLAAEEHKDVPEIRLSIPPALKSLLVDDWEFVTKHKRVLVLPRSPSVADLLNRYTVEEMPEGSEISAARETFTEIMDGLKLYFDRTLGLMLLYRNERTQLHDLIRKDPDFRPCDVYGVEHLLRLFVAMPGLIAQTSLDGQALAVLIKRHESLLVWIDKHKAELFNGEYAELVHSAVAQD